MFTAASITITTIISITITNMFTTIITTMIINTIMLTLITSSPYKMAGRRPADRLGGSARGGPGTRGGAEESEVTGPEKRNRKRGSNHEIT